MKRLYDPKSRSLLLRSQQMGRKSEAAFSLEELMALEKLLRAMLLYEHSKRANIRDVVKSEWFNRFALPISPKSIQATTRYLVEDRVTSTHYL